VRVRPDEVNCVGRKTLFGLQWRIFWDACHEPERLFGIVKNHKQKSFPVKWSFRAEILIFDILFADPTIIEAVSIQLDEYQVQYYLRNHVTLQLYGHANEKRKESANVLIDEIIAADHIIPTTEDDNGVVTLILFCRNDSCRRNSFTNLFLKLKSNSSLSHHMIGISIWELKRFR